jgi:hypothetical protein
MSYRPVPLSPVVSQSKEIGTGQFRVQSVEKTDVRSSWLLELLTKANVAIARKKPQR